MKVITNITGYKLISLISSRSVFNEASLRVALTKENIDYTDTIDFLLLQPYSLLSLKIYPMMSQLHFTNFILK